MTVPAQVLAAVRSIPHPRQEPDMTAPRPSPAEQAVIDRFGIFEPEEDVERVARALWRSDTEAEFPDADIDRLWPKVLSHFPADAAAYRRLAAAALAEMQPTAAEGADRG